MKNIVSYIEKIGVEYHKDFDSGLLSSMKIGAICKIAIFPKNTKELTKVLMILWNERVCFRVIGNASNVLFVEEISYPVIFTSKMKDEVEIDKNFVTASSGVLLSKLCDTLRKNRLSGLEALSGIPATVGGATITNAGAFGHSISESIVKIKVFCSGKIFDIAKNEIKFGYHFTNLSRFIILSVTFWFENKNEYDIINLTNKYTYLRNKTQPSGFSLGSVYRKVNSRSAGFYIERAGLKGMKVGGVLVSSKHSNFFINEAGGTAFDFLSLCRVVETAVEKQFGICLIPEIEQIGDKNEINFRFSHPFKI